MPAVPHDWIIKKMCGGCLRVSGNKCLVQTRPGYLWRKYKGCWSKITDPEKVREIEEAVMEYCGRKGVKYLPLAVEEVAV